METTKKKFHYGWLIMFCCCMYMFVGMGVLHHAIGQFINPVTSEMGFSLGQMNIYQTIMGYTQVVVLLFAGKLCEKYNLKILLSIMSAIFVIAYVIVANASSLISWYIAGFLWGISAAFLAPLPVPILINRWFAKKNGAMIGVAMIFSSIAGTILNPVIAAIIKSSGWRAGYWALGGIAFVLMFLPSLLIVRNRPSDKGLLPIGAEETADEDGKAINTEEWGLTLSQAIKTPAMWLLMLMAMLMTFGGTFMQYFTAYFQDLGLGLAAFAVSIGMVSGIVFKVPMGVLADKAGAYSVILIGSISAIIAFLSALLIPGSFVMYIGLVLYGISLSLSMITLPIYVRQTFGTKHYGSIWSIIVLCFNLMGATGHTILGFMKDATGGYTAAMKVDICVYVVLIVLGMVLVAVSKSMQKARTASIDETQLS